MDNLSKANLSSDILTMKSKLKTNVASSKQAGDSTSNVFRFDKKSLFTTILGLSPQWDNQPEFDYICQNKQK